MDPFEVEVPSHPLVADATARAVMHALAECDSLGIALLTSPRWTHALVNRAYESLIGRTDTLGRTLDDVVGEHEHVFRGAMVDMVAASGHALVLGSVPFTHRTTDGHMTYATLRLLRVTRAAPEDDAVLVLGEDVSVLAGERSENAMLSEAMHAGEELAAQHTSIFLLAPDGRRLVTALQCRDPIRNAAALLDSWPTVLRSVERNEATLMTHHEAGGDERRWFADGHLAAVVCAPMARDGRVVGVLFFDFVDPAAPDPDLADVKRLADRCADLFERRGDVRPSKKNAQR